MSDTNVKVGVFNVLANGVSYCSPLWESTTVKENQDKIFKALQALTLGVIYMDTTKLKEDCSKSVKLAVPSIIAEKINQLEQEKTNITDSVEKVKDLTDIIEALKTSKLIEHQLITNIHTAFTTNIRGFVRKTKLPDVYKDCYVGLELLQFIENEYNNQNTFKIENIGEFEPGTDAEFKVSIEHLKSLKEKFETFFNTKINSETPVSDIQNLSDKYNNILEPYEDHFLVKLVKSIKKAYKPKFTTCGKLIKGWLQNYANGTGFGLFGGFMVGGPHIPDATGAAGVTPWNMYDKVDQARFFIRKLNFIKREIKAFFSNSTDKDVRILVCPEFDYRHDVIQNITNGTNIQFIDSLGIRAGNGGEPIQPLNTSEDTSQLGKGVNTFSKADNNFCRVVFYSGNIKHKENDETYGEVIKQVKLASDDKETIDVISFENDSKEHVFDLIALHLNSTTSLNKTDLGKKINEIIALNHVKNISKTEKRNVIVAGDFNFPFNPVADGEGDPMEKNIPKGGNEGAFGRKLYGFDTSNITEEFKGGINAWNKLKDDLNMSDNDYQAGNVTKSRFTKQLGNDQLWEGKGEERKYNTDFIGYIPKTGNVKPDKRPELEDTFTLTPELRALLNQEKGYVPYLAETSQNDWLSDHALVFKNIMLSFNNNKATRHGLVASSAVKRSGGGMKYIRNRRNIKSRGNRRNSKKTRRNRRNRRKSIGKRRKTRRKIKSKRHSRKYKRL